MITKEQQMIEALRNHLAQLSNEALLSEWNAATARVAESPLAKDFIQTFEYFPALAPLADSFQSDKVSKDFNAGEYSYAMAA
jgi:hypothetical protein